MKSLENKLIIYDSNCKVCSSFRDLIVKLTPIPESKIKAYKDLSPHMLKQVDGAKFKNVMALIDTAGGETIYGAHGVAYIFSSQYKLVGKLFSIPFAFSVFNFLYKTQAYNRYIIATPKSNFACDCFPDTVVRYRISYVVTALLISLLLTALFGISLRHFAPKLSHLDAARQMLLIAGTGWLFQILLAIAIMKRQALDYIGHLGSIMVVGLLVLIPWMLWFAATGISSPFLPAVSVLVSSAYMLHLHIGRIKYLGRSQWWSVSWFLLLQSTAAFWLFFFHSK